jgi:ubiquinone/menaquinone biosynthesis C-methylase UbiE
MIARKMMAQRMQWTTFSGSGPELYQRTMVGPVFGPWATELLAVGAPSPGERVLDVACGTGAVTRLVAQRVGTTGRVVGLDISPGMLAVARASSDSWIEWLESSATASPLPDAAFDLVLCQQGLQYFPDRPAALREMRRVLAGDGRLALSVFCASSGHTAVADTMGSHLGPEAAALICGALDLADRDELRALLIGAGFRNVVIERVVRTVRFPSQDHFIEYLLTSRLADTMASLPEERRAALIDGARASLGAYVEAEALAFPMESHLAVAHR